MAIRNLQTISRVMSIQAQYAQEVGQVLSKAVSFVDDDYLRAVLGLTQEFVYSQMDVMESYVNLNSEYLSLRMMAVEAQMVPEKGNYLLSVSG